MTQRLEDLIREARTVYLSDAGDIGIRASVVYPHGEEYRYGSGYGDDAVEATARAIADAKATIAKESKAA